MDDKNADEMRRKALMVLGGRRVLLIGEDIVSLMAALLDWGIEAYGLAMPNCLQAALQQFPGRVLAFQGWDAIPKDQIFDSVILPYALDACPAAEIESALSALSRAGRLGIMIVTNAHAREFIEQTAFPLGLRRSLACFVAANYEGQEPNPWERTILLEPLPQAAYMRFPYPQCQENSAIPPDPLRCSGRQADAAIARYFKAINFVLDDYVVLDAACGCGHGAALLGRVTTAKKIIGMDSDAACIDYAIGNFGCDDPRLEYRKGNLDKLDFLADNSVDCVMSFDTIERLADPIPFLNEIHRVLRPGGRVIASVPDMWRDGTGSSSAAWPLYNWESFRALFDHQDWLIDRQHIQTAGGGTKVPEAVRCFRDVPLGEACPDEETEWCILTVMKTPLGASKSLYNNTRGGKALSHPDFNLMAWQRDYDNPFLFHSLVSRGERLIDAGRLRDHAVTIAREARPGSAEHGAALCVMAYQLLERGASWNEKEEFLGRLDAFKNEDTAHARRWRISLDYVSGLLCQSSGMLGRAKNYFIKTAQHDVVSLTPTLGTKTVHARCRIADICFGQGNDAEGLQFLQSAIEEARRLIAADWLNICGDVSEPIPIGLLEMILVLEQAYLAMSVINTRRHTPNYGRTFYDRYRHFHESELARPYRMCIQWRDSELAWVYEVRNAEIARIKELEQKVQELEEQLAELQDDGESSWSNLAKSG